MCDYAVPAAEVVPRAIELATELASKGADKKIYRMAKEAAFLEFLGGSGMSNFDVTGVDEKVFKLMQEKASKM